MALTITKEGARRVKSYGGTLRLAVVQLGCSGFSYKATVGDNINDNDHVYESNGVKIIVDSHSIPFLDGTQIDYDDTNLLSGGFKYNNPNAQDNCGCGSSFTIKEK